MSEPRKPIGGALGSTKSIKEQVKKSEQKTAMALGGVTTPGSGAFAGHKGDITTSTFVFEQKETWAGSIIVSRQHLVKIDREATAVRKLPAMSYKFNKIADGVEDTWIMVPLSVFAELLDKFNGK